MDLDAQLIALIVQEAWHEHAHDLGLDSRARLAHLRRREGEMVEAVRGLRELAARLIKQAREVKP